MDFFSLTLSQLSYQGRLQWIYFPYLFTSFKAQSYLFLDDNSNDSSVVLIPASPTETAAGKDTVFLYMAVDGFTYTNDKQSEVKQAT